MVGKVLVRLGTLISVVAVVATAVTVGATPGESRSEGEVVVTRVQHEPTPSRTAEPDFPPVVVRPIESPIRPSTGPSDQGGTTAVQVIRLEVVGGELTLETTEAEVVLRRRGDELVGELPPVRVVDARGTHEGWTVRAKMTGVETEGRRVGRGLVQLEPAEPTVVHGLPDGLSAGRPGTAAGNRTLFSAAPGSGGGTYEGGGTVSVEARHVRDVEQLTVTFRFVLG